jgi:uncharacterized integral membrane protein
VILVSVFLFFFLFFFPSSIVIILFFVSGVFIDFEASMYTQMSSSLFGIGKRIALHAW